MSTGQPVHEIPIEESLADRRVREAMESGHFDDLPGTGRPIPGAGTRDDEYWWVRSWLERNGYTRVPGPSKPS